MLALLAASALRAQAQVEAKPSSPDGRRTSARFFVNLGRSTVGIFARDNLGPFMIGAALTGASTAFDGDVRRYFGERRRAKWLGDAVDVEGQPHVLVPLALALYAAGRIVPRPQRFRDATYDVAQALVVDALYSTALKSVTHRLRPDGSNDLSFPSGHASNAFAWATVAAHHYGLKIAVPSYLVAGLIGVGRMEKNAHYLSDVMAGAALGTIVGLTVVRKDAPDAPRAPRVCVAPARDSYGSGAGVQVRVAF
jgi:membrane-associated phospholipid phosphatase